MMQQFHQALIDEINSLPFDKIGKVMSFVQFIKQEPETPIYLHPGEEEELDEIIRSDDFVSSAEVWASIEAMPDD